MLSRQSIINNEANGHLNQVDISHKKDSPPKEDEVKVAVGQLPNDRAAGADAIPAKVVPQS